MTDKTNKISVNVVLDRSGSMQSTKDGTISGYNEYINTLRQDKDSEYTVTLTQFDAPMTAPELTISYADRALADVPELTESGYSPRGNTPLYDAIGECTRRVNPKGRAVIMLIITDGMENASIEFNRETVKALIKEKEAVGWTFAFLGANIDSFAVGGSMGMAAGNIGNYVAGNEHALYSNLAHATLARSAAIRSGGAMQAKASPFLNDAQRAKIGTPPPKSATGGRPAAPPKFRPTPPPKPNRRDWNVNESA